MRWLPLLLIQRFSYRQIMYYVCFKAMLAASKAKQFEMHGALLHPGLVMRLTRVMSING